MEINPRIQVEHTVTEERFDGLDLVEWQLNIANGEPLPAAPALRDNHVIQVRLYAENPLNNFVASPGKLELLHLPEPSNILRIDRGYEEGDAVPPGLDPTIAKLIIRAPTREAARTSMIETLQNVLVTGVHANRDFLLWLLDSPEYKANGVWTTFIEDAWKAHQTNRFRDLQSFIGNGTFTEHNRPVDFDISQFHDIAYTRRAQKRRYSQDLAAQHATQPDTCGFRYGIFEDHATGAQLALGYWDFAVMGGTLGSEEGMALAALFQLAHSQNLPVVTITSSSGARQQEGAKALAMMDVMLAYRYQYEPSLYLNIYSGMNFGGVTVSLAESADIRIATNGSKIGFAGPDLVAKMMGKQSGRDLPVGAHSAQDHYASRNLELITKDLSEARARVLELCVNAGVIKAKPVPTYSHPVFAADVPTHRYDRPDSQRFVTMTADLTAHALDLTRPESLPASSDTPPAHTPSQRRALIRDGYRPTAAEYLSPELGIFESVAPLAGLEIKETNEEYPPIIAAIARLNGTSVMIIANQTQRRRREDGTVEKLYIAPRARDFRWARQQVTLAQKLHLPIIFLCDTTGGDASLDEEAQGVSREIAEFLGILHKKGAVTVPVISINIGENGSGGGLTFGRSADAAADLANAMTFVATPDAQIKILTDEWPTGDVSIRAIVDQLSDGTAEERLRMHQIDAIIAEPAGGAQADPALVAKNIRAFLLNHLEILQAMDPDQLAAHRFARARRSGEFATKPHSQELPKTSITE